MRRATAQALRWRDSRVVAATRGVTCSVSMPCSGRCGSSAPGSTLSSQAAAMRPLFSAVASATSSNRPECAVLTTHLVRLAVAQEAVAEQAVVAAEVVELDAQHVGALDQLAQAGSGSTCQSRPRRGRSHAAPGRSRGCGRRSAASSWAIVRADGGMPTRPMVAPPSSRPASEPSAPRTGTRRSSDSIAPMTNSASARALAVRLRTTSTLAPLAGLEVDVLGAGADPADRAQHRREIERLGVDARPTTARSAARTL